MNCKYCKQPVRPVQASDGPFAHMASEAYGRLHPGKKMYIHTNDKFYCLDVAAGANMTTMAEPEDTSG